MSGVAAWCYCGRWYASVVLLSIAVSGCNRADPFQRDVGKFIGQVIARVDGDLVEVVVGIPKAGGAGDVVVVAKHPRREFGSSVTVLGGGNQCLKRTEVPVSYRDWDDPDVFTFHLEESCKRADLVVRYAIKRKGVTEVATSEEEKIIKVGNGEIVEQVTVPFRIPETSPD